MIRMALFSPSSVNMLIACDLLYIYKTRSFKCSLLWVWFMNLCVAEVFSRVLWNNAKCLNYHFPPIMNLKIKLSLIIKITPEMTSSPQNTPQTICHTALRVKLLKMHRHIWFEGQNYVKPHNLYFWSNINIEILAVNGQQHSFRHTKGCSCESVKFLR